MRTTIEGEACRPPCASRTPRTSWICGVLLALCVAGCSDDKVKLAPTASGSALATSAPKTATSKKFVVDTGASTVGFMMEAPDEKIRGRAPSAADGYLNIDPKDLSQTNGNIVVDIDKLELVQRKKKDGQFAEEVKEPKQNEHARAWLEIDDSTPEDVRKEHRRVEFRIDSISDLSEKDLTKLSGAERTVTFTASGEFLLHKRTSKKTVKMKATFTFEGDTATAVVVKTESPLAVSLAEHDVRPRDAFGKLAAKTLDDLGSKVAKEAQVELEIRLMLEGGKPAPPAPAPTVSAAATAAPTATMEAAGSAAPSASAAPASSASAPPSAGKK